MLSATIDLADATLRKVGRRPDGLEGARTAHHREGYVGRSVTDRATSDAARIADISRHRTTPIFW